MKSLSGTSGFCFLFPDATVFYIPLSRKISLKQYHMANSAHTKKRGQFKRGYWLIHCLLLQYCLSQLLVCRVLSRRPLLGSHPLCDNRHHLAAITRSSHETSGQGRPPLAELGDAPLHTIIFITKIWNKLFCLYTWPALTELQINRYRNEIQIHGNSAVGRRCLKSKNLHSMIF